MSDIYANPDQFGGKRVRVQGPIVDVCAERGCWIAIGSDQEFQSLRFKVEDGVIVFPMETKGQTASVEGVLTVATLGVAADRTRRAHGQGEEDHLRPEDGEGPEVLHHDQGRRGGSLLNWRRLNDIVHRDAGYLAVGLILMAVTGMFVLKGRTGITGRGAWLVSAGVLLPVVYWLAHLLTA